MTDDEIEAIRARLASSTPGPWKASTDDAGDVVVWGPDEDWLANVGNWARQHPGIDADAAARQFVETRDAADATLIAHAPTDLAALCDEVERLRAWLLRGGKLTDEELKALKPWRRRLGIVGNDNSVTYNGDDIVSVARVPLDDDVARLIEEQNALLDEVIRLRAGLARTDLAWDRLQDAVIVQDALTTRAEKAEAALATAREQGRKEGLERAAVIAEVVPHYPFPAGCGRECCEKPKRIASAIRAERDRKPGGGT